MKTVKYRSMGQNRDTRNKPMPIWSIDIFGKGGEKIHWGKHVSFKKWYWENWTDICKK